MFDMKRALNAAIAAGCAALALAAGPATAQETPDKWGVTPSEWSTMSGSNILSKIGASARGSEIEKAAQAGDGAANVLKCFALETGLWGYTDLFGAWAACQTSANVGFPRGKRNLGRAYELGWNGTVDLATAAYWYCQAAADGNALAHYGCGRAKEHGWGGSVSYPDAAVWYCNGAQLGDPYSMYGCGLSWEHSWRGIWSRDVQTADSWYAKAAAAGVKEAQEKLYIAALANGGSQDAYYPTCQTIWVPCSSYGTQMCQSEVCN